MSSLSSQAKLLATQASNPALAQAVAAVEFPGRVHLAGTDPAVVCERSVRCARRPPPVLTTRPPV